MDDNEDNEYDFDKLNWDNLSRNSCAIPLLRKYPRYINWAKMSANSKGWNCCFIFVYSFINVY